MASTGSAGATRVMAMTSSESEDSYAENSSIQNNGFHIMAKPALAKAVDNIVVTHIAPARHRHVAIADLGCSYGRNTLDCAEFVLQALQESWARTAGMTEDLMEIQYYFSDLPCNDFNALFRSLHPNTPISPDGSVENPKMYVAGVPGSFHGRLFPSASLDLVVCSYSLHWLSQVPPSVVDKFSKAWNGGRTWIYNAPQDVVDAYVLQSQMDVKKFLQSRTHELASGGILFLLTVSFTKNGCSSSPYFCPAYELFDCAWQEMVNEGIITMEDMDTFNFPAYFINQHELQCVLKDVPKLKVLHMETINMTNKQKEFPLHQWIQMITSAIKPTVESHLGKHKALKLFEKFKQIGCKQNSPSSHFTKYSMIVSLQRI